MLSLLLEGTPAAPSYGSTSPVRRAASSHNQRKCNFWWKPTTSKYLKAHSQSGEHLLKCSLFANTDFLLRWKIIWIPHLLLTTLRPNVPISTSILNTVKTLDKHCVDLNVKKWWFHCADMSHLPCSVHIFIMDLSRKQNQSRASLQEMLSSVCLWITTQEFWSYSFSVVTQEDQSRRSKMKKKSTSYKMFSIYTASQNRLWKPLHLCCATSTKEEVLFF